MFVCHLAHILVTCLSFSKNMMVFVCSFAGTTTGALLSLGDLRKPDVAVCRGRPKGRDKTVIGLPKRRHRDGPQKFRHQLPSEREKGTILCFSFRRCSVSYIMIIPTGTAMHDGKTVVTNKQNAIILKILRLLVISHTSIIDNIVDT